MATSLTHQSFRSTTLNMWTKLFAVIKVSQALLSLCCGVSLPKVCSPLFSLVAQWDKHLDWDAKGVRFGSQPRLPAHP